MNREQFAKEARFVRKAGAAVLSAWIPVMKQALPSSRYEVVWRDGSTSFRYSGKGADTVFGSTTLMIVLGLPGTVDEKLERTFRMLATSLAGLITTAEGRQWPEPGLDLQISVAPEAVRVSWTRPSDGAEAYSLPAFSRTHIGI